MERRTVKHLQESLRGMERIIADRASQLELLKQSAQSLRQIIALFGAEAENDPRDGADQLSRESTMRMPRSDAKVARNAIYEILRESGRPMHARKLLTELAARGISVVGKDPLNNVRSHLSHDTRFMPVGGGEWDLASRANLSRSNPLPTQIPRPALTVIEVPPEPPPNDELLVSEPTEDDWLDDPSVDEEREDELTHSGF